MIKIIFFISLFILDSCGFQTVYHDEKDIEATYVEKLAQIRIQKTRLRFDQELKNNLYDLLNPDLVKAEAKYLLILSSNVTSYPTFITETGASGRNKVMINISYQLKDLETGSTIGKGATTVNDNYDVSLNRYGTFVADEYIKSNLTKVAAANIRNYLVNDFIELEKKENQAKEEKEKNEKELIKKGSKKIKNNNKNQEDSLIE